MRLLTRLGLLATTGLCAAFCSADSRLAVAQDGQDPPVVVLTDTEKGELTANVWQFKVLKLDEKRDEEIIAEGRIRLDGKAIFFSDADNVDEAEDRVRVGDLELKRRSGGTLEVRLTFKETLQLPDFIKGLAVLTYDKDEPGGIWNGSFLPEAADGRRTPLKFELRKTEG